jgi:hypothetical protein
VEHGVDITQEGAPDLCIGAAAHAGTSPAAPVRDATPAVATAAATAAAGGGAASTAAAATRVLLLACCFGCCWMPPLLPPPLVSKLLLLPPLRGNRTVCSDILCERQ